MSSPAADPNPSGEVTRTGYVTLVGRPNAGKSTLLNAFIGEPLSIVTPKAQTTWQRITGILTTVNAQMVFLDTPGLLEPKDLLQRAMLASALEALGEADVVLLVVDASEPVAPAEREVVNRSLEGVGSVPLLVAINKVDRVGEGAVRPLVAWVEEELKGKAFPVSALKSQGLSALLPALESALPPGPFLYPADEIARDPVRFFVAEMIRETVFQEYSKEIPYSTFCQIEEFRENQEPVYIQADLFVERNSQKRILIGKGGRSIRNLGAISRKKIEDFLGVPVYLDLWVKVLQDWRRRRGHLKRLGFPVPEEDAADARG